MLKGFTKFEQWLIVVNIVVSAALMVIGNDYSWLSWMGFISSISNTICVVLVAKQKISNYIWGIVAVLTYAVVAYAFGNTGEWVHNLFFYLPANMLGWYMWKKHTSIYKDVDVDSKFMEPPVAIAVYAATAAAILVFAIIISQPAVQVLFYGKVYDYGFDKYLVDSLTTIMSVTAMLLMCYCYAEQWLLWIIIDVASIILWIYTFDLMMILMWTTMLVNAVYGWIKWKGSVRK